MKRSVLVLSVLALIAPSFGCGAYSRFALRPPVWNEGDDRPFLPIPANDEEQDIANTVDAILLHPMSHGLLFAPATEAYNVNALDEVPDSTWFTNRTLTPDEVERGACYDEEPVLPLTVVSTKVGGTTAGFVVEDASGQRYVMKLDGRLGLQPEISTAADSIVSRLYFAVGFNVPCNSVLYVARGDLLRGERATERLDTGERRPLTDARLDEILSRATRGAEGLLRMSASRFIDGVPVGTWRAEGTRADDPNDLIPHEERRELRGERFLAAWVAHWDSRGPQSYDAFVRVSDRGGYVLHYFLDFSDSLGAYLLRTGWPEPRIGYRTVADPSDLFGNAVTFGFARPPYDEVEPDPRYPNLGYFGSEPLDPLGFAPQTPLVRWERAQVGDLGWMARRLARFEAAHIEAAVRTGRLSDPAEEQRLIELLLLRREAVMRVAFARSSPLADLAVIDDRLCAVDLAVTTGLIEDFAVGYEFAFREALEERSHTLPYVHDGPLVCVDMHHHFAPASAPDESRERYATLDIVRDEHREETVRTTLRAHFYDLGEERGFVLVGIERL